MIAELWITKCCSKLTLCEGGSVLEIRGSSSGYRSGCRKAPMATTTTLPALIQAEGLEMASQCTSWIPGRWPAPGTHEVKWSAWHLLLHIITHYIIFLHWSLLHILIISIFTSFLQVLPIITLPIITYYYKFVITYYYVIITSLLRRHHIITTNGKSCNNDYYALLRHYYTRAYHYPSLHISVSRTCRWAGAHLACVVSRNGQHPVVPWSPKQTRTCIGKKAQISAAKLHYNPQIWCYFAISLISLAEWLSHIILQFACHSVWTTTTLKQFRNFTLLLQTYFIFAIIQHVRNNSACSQ